MSLHIYCKKIEISIFLARVSITGVKLYILTSYTRPDVGILKTELCQIQVVLDRRNSWLYLTLFASLIPTSHQTLMSPMQVPRV